MSTRRSRSFSSSAVRGKNETDKSTTSTTIPTTPTTTVKSTNQRSKLTPSTSTSTSTFTSRTTRNSSIASSITKPITTIHTSSDISNTRNATTTTVTVTATSVTIHNTSITSKRPSALQTAINAANAKQSQRTTTVSATNGSNSSNHTDIHTNSSYSSSSRPSWSDLQTETDNDAYTFQSSKSAITTPSRTIVKSSSLSASSASKLTSKTSSEAVHSYSRSSYSLTPLMSSDSTTTAVEDDEVVDENDGLIRVDGAGKSNYKNKKRKSNGVTDTNGKSKLSTSKVSKLAHNHDLSNSNDNDHNDGESRFLTQRAQMYQHTIEDASDADDQGLPMTHIAREALSTRLNYFDVTATPCKTSTNTLAKLKIITEERRAAIMNALPEKHAVEKKRLLGYHRSQFRNWFLQLKSNFNLLFYGFGSKKAIIHEFVSTWCTDGPILVVNGYFPGLTIKTILTLITTNILQHEGTFRDHFLHFDFIKTFFENNNYNQHKQQQQTQSSNELTSSRNSSRFPITFSSNSGSDIFLQHLYLIIHNLDGTPLRSELAQQILALLATIPNIHIIASMDHILAPLLWDHSLLSCYRFLSHDVTTYARYDRETLYETSLLSGRDTDRALGIKFVLQSLTPNHADILAVLAKHIVEKGNTQGMSFTEFYGECSDNMLVSSEVNFRTHLTELLDHSLVEKKRMDARDVYSIPYSINVIKKEILGMDITQEGEEEEEEKQDDDLAIS